jgi:hypothetical protein
MTSHSQMNTQDFHFDHNMTKYARFNVHLHLTNEKISFQIFDPHSQNTSHQTSS